MPVPVFPSRSLTVNGLFRDSLCFADASLLASAEDLDRMFNVNVRATHFCLRAAARAMIAQGRGGRIVTAGSIAGQRGK